MLRKRESLIEKWICLKKLNIGKKFLYYKLKQINLWKPIKIKPTKQNQNAKEPIELRFVHKTQLNAKLKLSLERFAKSY